MDSRTSPVWHPFTQMKGITHFPEVRSASGYRLQLTDGRELIDAISSWWVITHGHCDPAIAAAIAEQAKTLDQVIFAGFTHPMAETVAAELVSLTPEPLTRVFFSDDGSTAVEVALKMAVQSQRQRGQSERKGFLAFAAAYHGDTVGAMSVGDESAFTAAFSDMTFPVIRAQHPSHSEAGAQAYVADFLDKMERHGDRLAAVIVEPLIQGAGGMIVWPPEALRIIADTCRERGVYLIFDEVMTGFGRTGALFAMNKADVVPDLVCLAKGVTGGTLPLAITMTGEEIYGSFLSDNRHHTFFHGHSFTANPIACAAACANFKLYRERDMPAAWAAIEGIHQEYLGQLKSHRLVADARMCGTIAAVALRDDGSGYLSNFGPKMYAHANQRGVLLRPLGNVLYLMPPYGISATALHRCWEVLLECVEVAAS